VRIALAQINSRLGDFKYNKGQIISYTKKALERHCDLVIFPELSLFGYRPSDLLERKPIVSDQLKYLKQIGKEIPKNIGILFGAITENNGPGKALFNSAVFMEKGKKPVLFHKELLPTYDVFDEYRHIEHGQTGKTILKFKSKKILITICEDIWAWEFKGYKNLYPKNPLIKVKEKVDLVVNISASPFSITKESQRKTVCQLTAKKFKAPLVYVNMVGAQDELIFDGGSFVIDPNGKILTQSVQFNEDINVFDMKTSLGGKRPQKLSEIEKLRQALVLGIRDFAQKVGFERLHLGLSGGIDSAVVACLSADALRPTCVTGIALPGPFNLPESFTWAAKLAKNLGIEFKSVPITDIYNQTLATLEKSWEPLAFSVLHENLQARIRANVLMAFANYKNSLLLTTGNKSEYASGYCTLYGDMCGGLAPIGDLLKGQVYALAHHYNLEHELIPSEIITRPPSAELRPNQKDQDTLPEYEKLDKAVINIVENKKPVSNEIESWLLNSLLRSEFKRWQAPPILRISQHAFGRGRFFPIAHNAKV